MNDENATSPGRKVKTLAAIVLIAICIGGVIGYFSFRDQSAGGSIEYFLDSMKAKASRDQPSE